jgi:hypothetical protein
MPRVAIGAGGDTPSPQGALVSGRRTAREVLRELDVVPPADPEPPCTSRELQTIGQPWFGPGGEGNGRW